jgi:hypothetical protein
MKQTELQQHYKRIFETTSGKVVLADLERITNTTRVTSDNPNPNSAIYIVAQQHLLKRIRNMCLLRTATTETEQNYNE